MTNRGPLSVSPPHRSWAQRCCEMMCRERGPGAEGSEWATQSEASVVGMCQAGGLGKGGPRGVMKAGQDGVLKSRCPRPGVCLICLMSLSVSLSTCASINANANANSSSNSSSSASASVSEKWVHRRQRRREQGGGFVMGLRRGSRGSPVNSNSSRGCQWADVQ